MSKYDRPENYKPPKPKPKKVVEESKDGDGDVLMDDMATPKKKPPNIGKKPVSKKKKAPAADTAEDDEKKPAAASAPAPKKAATSGSTKGPTAPIIADDNIGAGLDAEQAIEMVEANFSSDAVKSFDAAKW
jgi:hypothetical protein